MNTFESKNNDKSNQSAAVKKSTKQEGQERSDDFIDNRPEASDLNQLQELANNSKNSEQAIQLKSMASNYVAGNNTIQRKANETGLPEKLKSGVEQLSGLSMDDVEVNYNSDKPSDLNAHAYAQGSNIELAPRQEQHLAHEAWHVVQQKQGRVNDEIQLKGDKDKSSDTTEELSSTESAAPAAANPAPSEDAPAVVESPELEREADEMGAESEALGAIETSPASEEPPENVQIAEFLNEAAPSKNAESSTEEEELESTEEEEASPSTDTESEEEPEDLEEDASSLDAIEDSEEVSQLAAPVESQIANIEDATQGAPPSPAVSDTVTSAHAISTSLASEENEDVNQTAADAKRIETINAELQVETRNKAKEETELPALGEALDTEETLPELERVESTDTDTEAGLDESPSEVIIHESPAAPQDRINNHITEDEVSAINRIHSKAKSSKSISILDLEIISQIAAKIPQKEFEINDEFSQLDILVADLSDGKIRIVSKDKDGEEVEAASPALSKSDLASEALSATSDVTGLTGQMGTGFTENSGVSTLNPEKLAEVKGLIEEGFLKFCGIEVDDKAQEERESEFENWLKEKIGSDYTSTTTSGASDTFGGSAEYLTAMAAYKGLLDQRFGDAWNKKSAEEKAVWYASLGQSVSSQFAAAYKTTAGIMDWAKKGQDETATNVFTGKALKNNAKGGGGGRMADTSSVKFVGDVSGVAAGGFKTIAESLEMMGSFRKWAAKKDKWNKESAGKGLLNTAKTAQNVAGLTRDAYRLALQTGAASAAEATGAAVASTGLGVAVGSLAAIRSGYLLRKYKDRLKDLQTKRQERGTTDEAAETMLDVEDVLKKKINRQWVSLASSTASVVAGALALTGVGAIAGIALGALAGGMKLIHTSFKGFRQWRRNVNARKHLETHDNWKRRQLAKIALTDNSMKKAKYKAIIKTTLNSGFAKDQKYAGESFAEWKKRQNWATIKTTANWDKSSGAKQIDNVKLAAKMRQLKEPTLYKALGLSMEEIIDKESHDAEVIKKLISRG